MTTLLAIIVGALYAGAIYMMTRRSLVKLVVGLALMSHAANLLIFSVNRLKRGAPPLIAAGGSLRFEAASDPLPQALILTAIVISFAVLAFALALLHRIFQIAGCDDLDRIRSTESET